MLLDEVQICVEMSLMEGEQVCTVPVTNVFVSAPRHAWLPGERGNGSCSVKTFHFPVGLTVNLVSRGQRRHAAGKGLAFLVLEYSLAQQSVAAGLAVTASTPEHRWFPQHPLLQPYCRAQQPAAARVAAKPSGGVKAFSIWSTVFYVTPGFWQRKIPANSTHTAS